MPREIRLVGDVRIGLGFGLLFLLATILVTLEEFKQKKKKLEEAKREGGVQGATRLQFVQEP